MKYRCDDCEHVGNVEDMPIKMGGLLCPSCRKILYFPYQQDGVWAKELDRRRKEGSKEDREDESE